MTLLGLLEDRDKEIKLLEKKLEESTVLLAEASRAIRINWIKEHAIRAVAITALFAFTVWCLDTVFRRVI